MYQLAVVYLASILAGFALANLPTSAVITPGVANFFEVIGGIAIIVFSIALLFDGLRTLIKKYR